jgi:hypothetical protein
MTGAGGSVSCARRSGSWRGGHGGHFVRQVESLTDQGQKRLDRAITGQMQQDAVFVLFDSGGDLEQSEHDGSGFGRSQACSLQRQAAQLRVQDISRCRPQQAGGVGEKGRRRGTVGFQIALHWLDQILYLTAGTVVLLVERAGRGSAQGGDDKALIVFDRRFATARQHFGLEHHAEGLRPGSGRLLKVTEKPHASTVGPRP